MFHFDMNKEQVKFWANSIHQSSRISEGNAIGIVEWTLIDPSEVQTPSVHGPILMLTFNVGLFSNQINKLQQIDLCLAVILHGVNTF